LINPCKEGLLKTDTNLYNPEKVKKGHNVALKIKINLSQASKCNGKKTV
jgi:hypothetical protein